MSFLELRDVSLRYDNGYLAVEGVNLSIAQGEFVALVGPSGCGKSTLLRVVSGLRPPSQGEALYQGQPIRGPMGNVGIAFQNATLLPWRNVLQNVLLPLAVTGLDPKVAQSRARAALEKVGLSAKEDLSPIELSGGEQQRLAIARAIVNRPAILIADEPTANLDRENARRILSVFRDFNRVGVTTLIASHDEALMAEHASRTFRIEPGHFFDQSAKRSAP